MRLTSILAAGVILAASSLSSSAADAPLPERLTLKQCIGIALTNQAQVLIARNDLAGAHRRDIQRQFLIEAMVLSLVGGIVGILMGAGMSAAISRMSELDAAVSLTSVVLAFCFSAFVGIFFGIYPARKATALDPIDALRYE
jgi:putative ABC transport system permease protein